MISLSSSRPYRIVAAALSLPRCFSCVGLHIPGAICRTTSCSDGGDSARRRELFAAASHSGTLERVTCAALEDPVPHPSLLGSQTLPARYSPDAEGTDCSLRVDVAADGSGGVTHSASTMSLKLPLHKRRCIFVDSTQQIIAAASGDGSRDRRSKRKRTTSSQLDILVASFVQSDSPSYETRAELASVCLPHRLVIAVETRANPFRCSGVT